mgnify:CR=1 FL=1
MSNKKVLLTREWLLELGEELRHLKEEKRVEIADKLKEAISYGDLSENGDYDAAKNKSGLVEAKIRDIEARLAMAQIIDPSKVTSVERVVFGLSVEIEDVDSREKKRLCIVGAEESDVDRGWISFESPLGKALIGKQVGDLARVHLPGGAREFEILEIFVEYEEATGS